MSHLRLKQGIEPRKDEPVKYFANNFPLVVRMTTQLFC